jgi:hypothetical protein
MAEHRLIKETKIYPIDDAEIVVDDLSVSIKTCTSCGYDGWLRPEICKKV